MMQIAIDGPAASGKTTVAQEVARRLNLHYFDTGSMYRAVAYMALRTQTEADNEPALVRLCDRVPVRAQFDDRSFAGARIFAGDDELRQPQLESPQVTAVVSTIAAHPRVRELMVREQRRVAGRHDVVMAGRDIGTVVLPDATHKIFLTASVPARVSRRRAQLEAAGLAVAPRALADEIAERDHLDATRSTSPLRKAEDAHEIDSSNLTVEQVADEICRIVSAA